MNNINMDKTRDTPIPVATGIEMFLCNCKEQFISVKDNSRYTDDKGRCFIRCKSCGQLYEINGEFKKELCKMKHIYHIYMSKDDSIHIEKFPIVYINKNYVYFKGASDIELSKIELKKCYYNLSDIICYINGLIESKKINNYFEFSRWFFNMNMTENQLYNENITCIKKLIYQYDSYQKILSGFKQVENDKKRFESNINDLNKRIERYSTLYGVDTDLENKIQELNKILGGEENESN